jgi:BirA family biotin operon repressor/biotin-[acetyl-CoA-carboxylase] ligase
MKIIKLKTIDSTHRYLLNLIENNLIKDYVDGDNDAFAVIADNQTNGVGRCNRDWVSLPGNLFASIVMKLPENDVSQISLAVACAVRESVLQCIMDNSGIIGENNLQNDRFLSSVLNKTKLHWPNDVYYDKKKISGVLISVCDNLIVVSVGMNINSAPSVSCKSICLKDILKRKIKIVISKKILDILVKNINQWFFYLKTIGFSCIRSYWLSNINEIGCEIVIKNGHDCVNGIFTDIDDYGRVILERGGERLFISSGDLFINQEGIVMQHG